MEMRAIGLLLVVAGVVAMVAMYLAGVDGTTGQILMVLGGVVTLLGGYLAYQSDGSSGEAPTE